MKTRKLKKHFKRASIKARRINKIMAIAKKYMDAYSAAHSAAYAIQLAANKILGVFKGPSGAVGDFVSFDSPGGKAEDFDNGSVITFKSIDK